MEIDFKKSLIIASTLMRANIVSGLIQMDRPKDVIVENKPQNVHSKKLSNEYVLDKLNEFKLMAGRYPTIGRGYWSTHDRKTLSFVGVPSLNVYKERFGNYTRAKEEALKREQELLEKEYGDNVVCEQDLPYQELLAPVSQLQ